MLFVTIIQLIVFITYISYLVNKFGVLPSISESYYALMDSKKSYLFFLFTSALGITMILQAQDQYVGYLISGVGLLFVGGASLFKLKKGGIAAIHYTGAAVGIVSALIGHIEVYNIFWPVGIYLAGTLIILAILRNGAYIWWIEILAFITIIAGFISQLTL